MNDAGGGQRIIFDVYGTLLDVGSPVARLEREIGPRADHLSDLWRDRQLQLAWLSTFVGRHRSFWSITEESLTIALRRLGLDKREGLEDALLDAYRSPDSFREVQPALLELKRNGAFLAVLSNANLDMLLPALRQARLDDLFDSVISVDPIKAFKPDRRAYALGQKEVGGSASETWFVSSNSWDISGARTHGFRAIWIDRAGLGVADGIYEDVEAVRTVSELVDLLKSSMTPN